MNKLIEDLRAAKARLGEAKEAVFQAEAAVYLHYKEQLADEGTFNVEDLKIKTGFYDKWSQEALIEARSGYPKDEPFPFLTEYKPDTKQLKYLKEHKPALYEIVKVALSRTPKKPSFEIKGEKNDD